MNLTSAKPRLSSPKTVFLAGSLHDISFLAYDHGVKRFPLFQYFISHALEEKDQVVVYAYYSTNLTSTFKNDIAEKKIIVYELRNGVNGLTILLNELRQQATGNPHRILFVFDFSRRCDLAPILALLREIKSIRDRPVLISGIAAFNLHVISDEYVQQISAIIPSVIFISNTRNMIAFPALVSRESSIAGIISQDIVDSVVKHSLEQLILMNLKQPVSGFDILKDISDRFHVGIPLARVYSYLYNLESIGVVTMEIRGRSKVYVPTEKGRIFIDMRLHDLQTAHEFILGYKR
jgi:hypothetical protein